MSILENIIKITSAAASGSFKGLNFRAGLGAEGVVAAAEKREGDGKTPLGIYPLRYILWRKDRMPPPQTSLKITALSPNYGWCDEGGHISYNQFVKLPFSGGYEVLWREDGLYDIIIVVGFNDFEVRPFGGSAIFIHCLAPNSSPTKGCVALTKKDLLAVIALCDAETKIEIC